MLGQDTLRYAGYAAAVIVILTLTGIFNSFEGRDVLADTLSLSTILLIGALVGTGYLTANTVRSESPQVVAINAVVGSLIAGLALSALVLFTEVVNTGFVFPNLGRLLGSPVTFGQEDFFSGVLMLLGFSALMGVVATLLVYLPERARNALFISLSLTIVIGILQGQINNIITLPDALALALVFSAGYAAAVILDTLSLPSRLGTGAVIGLIGGVILAVVANSAGMEAGAWIGSRVPVILSLAPRGNFIPLILIFAGIGAAGGMMRRAPASIHNGAWGFFVGLLVLGLLNWQREMTLLMGAVTLVLISVAQLLLPQIGAQVETGYERLPRTDQQLTRGLAFIALLTVLIFIPPFAGLSITNTINLTALYITMGIGLSVMIGYAGLLDLGYVASYAIGAYTIGLLTTPSLLTCGGITAEQIQQQGLNVQQVCTGVISFWQGVPIAVLVSSMTGILLGIPVLRLRGDYLAIVTLGFGEIIQVLIKSNTFKPLLGGAQGIISIPLPHLNLSFLNPNWDFTLTKSTEVYYLYIFGVLVAAFIVLRLVNTKLGRAWRAMREDEDVAEAMGIHLVSTKLLAFAISSAFAGLGGAIFGASFQSIFPNSFTLLVSINVLSLIIIGGMGSIPGVVLGAAILIGLPEVLRELQDYRLLAFGALLVLVMILKPEGLIPPQPPKLSEQASPQTAAGD
jgi:branched-chain amino acid transport system permease protein